MPRPAGPCPAEPCLAMPCQPRLAAPCRASPRRALPCLACPLPIEYGPDTVCDHVNHGHQYRTDDRGQDYVIYWHLPPFPPSARARLPTEPVAGTSIRPLSPRAAAQARPRPALAPPSAG